MTKNKTEECVYVPLDDEKNFYHSYDIGLVAYLLSKKYILSAMEKVGKKAKFIIERDEHIETEAQNYWNSKTLIDAQSYHNQLKRLKNQLYNS
jgi:hypothetical protein